MAGTTRCGHYTVGELARLAGVSARTLRHYEDVGLLVPARSPNGYRRYAPTDARRLAQILAMRACGLALPTIRSLLHAQGADVRAALVDHLRALRAQERSLAEAVLRTEAALARVERMEGMDTTTAFETLKEHERARFEEEFGRAARERYGNDAIDETNARMMALTKDEWEAKELLEEAIKVQLRLAMATGDVGSEESAELAHLHERWMRVHWGGSYTTEAHRALAHAYLADERFGIYYDTASGPGATVFLVSVLDYHLPTT